MDIARAIFVPQSSKLPFKYIRRTLYISYPIFYFVHWYLEAVFKSKHFSKILASKINHKMLLSLTQPFILMINKKNLSKISVEFRGKQG